MRYHILQGSLDAMTHSRVVWIGHDTLQGSLDGYDTLQGSLDGYDTLHGRVDEVSHIAV